MTTEELWERLERAVTLEGDDAAIRVNAEYEPQGGPQMKVFPPTYLPGANSSTKYHLEKRWDTEGHDVDVVLLDSIQSQAKRAGVALSEVASEIGLPQIALEAKLPDRVVRISSLVAPHRSRDAYLLDAEIAGVPFDQTSIGQALNGVTPEDSTAALTYAPYDLVYGVWDSHRGKRVAIRFPRVYTSEMIGWHVLPGKRAATKGDPFNLPGKDEVPIKEWRPETATAQKKKENIKLNELGHGMIPGSPDEEAGGVSVRTIDRQAVLSLTGLARLRFPLDSNTADPTGRVALAAIALLGDRLAFSRAGISLRSGCDLVLLGDHLEWVQAGGRVEPLDIDADGAQALVELAAHKLGELGIGWSGDPVVVTPSARLADVIERTFYVPDLDAED
ncbi:MAG: type I-G CRISPR-associated RAMP protein Csb1/Cas7g [Actinomycetota bacterium]